MPEIENQLPERGTQPPTESGAPYSKDTVVGLQTLAQVHRLYGAYRMTVAKTLAFDADGNLVARNIYKRIESIQSFDAFQLLLVLWKESRFPTAVELQIAGLPPRACRDGLTRGALGDLLEGSDELRRAMVEECIQPPATDMFLRRAERLTKDFFYFGLVEHYVEPPRKPRANWKPLRATARLDLLMRHAGVACAHFRRAGDNVTDGIVASPTT